MDVKQFVNELINSNKIRHVLLVLAVLHLLLLMCYSLPKRVLRTDKNRDLLAYYLVSERIQKGGAVYWPLPQIGPHDPSPNLYLYPPVFASLLGFIPTKSFVTFSKTWTILLYLMFWVYAVCLARLASGKVSLSGTLIAGLVLTLFPGTHSALSLGNVDPFLWALFGLALVIPTLRGSGLMAIALVKPWAVWPLIWSFREGKKVLIGSLLVTFIGTSLGMFVIGPTKFFSNCSIWIREVLPSLGQGSWSLGIWGNWSLSFAVLRVIKALDLWNYQGGVLPLWARSWLLLAGISAPLLSGWLLRLKSKVLQLSVMGCTAVLFAPTCWTYYLPLLLSPIAVITGNVLSYQEETLNDKK